MTDLKDLQRQIAKDLTENDELGSEYCYVMALKEENARLRSQLDRAKEALKFYAHSVHVWRESERKPGTVTDPIGHKARRALEAIERMEREGK